MADERKRTMTLGELKTHVDSRFTEVDRRFDEVDRQFANVDRRFERLEDRLLAEAVETRRHFDVVAERLEGHFRLLAERGDVDHQRLENHETRIRALEKRR